MGIFDWFSKNSKAKTKPVRQSDLAAPSLQQEPKMWQCRCGRKNFDYVSSCACGASKRGVTAPSGSVEKKSKDALGNQVVFENRAISARPPYVVLRLDGAYYIQLFDLMCRRFFDITRSPEGNYSIALFRLRDEEVAWVQNNTEKLDQLANKLYERIPGDRFVKASMVTPSGETVPLSIRPGCDSIDPPTVSTELHLNLSADILSDAQKEKYIYSPLKTGIPLTREQVKDLSLGERLSVAFVTKNAPMHEMPAQAEKAKTDNYGFMMSMAVEWLKNNPFYILSYKNDEPLKIANNGITFTCVFSTEQLAEKTRNGNPLLQCAMIKSDKIAFWKQLSEKGIAHIVADNNPLTLTVTGCLIYAMAEIADNNARDHASTQNPAELPKELMISQLPALYLKGNNNFYREKYMEKLSSLGIKKEEAQKLFDFECGVIKRFNKRYLEDTIFVKTWIFGLKFPFFQTYPKTKEDILKEKSLTIGEICKLIDEAEWHYWNSHERNLSDEVWEEIFDWRIQGKGGEFALHYFEKIAEDIGVPMSSISALSRENGTHLRRYKWG